MTAAAPEPPAPLASPAPLARFGALTCCYFATMGLFSPYAPLWFQSLGMSALAIGTVASLQSWTRVLMPYAWGWMGDHSGRRVELIRVAAAGSLLSALGLLGVQAATAVATMTVLLFVCNGGVIPLFEASLAHLLKAGSGIDPQRYGRVRMWGSVGFIISVMTCGALLETMGIAAFPWLVAALNALLLIVALRLPRLREPAHSTEPAPPMLRRLREPAVAWFFASIFFTVLAHTSLYTFFSLYLVQLGYDKTAVGTLWAVAISVEILFFWQQGRWFRRMSSERWLQLVAAVTVLRFAAVAGLGEWPAVLVLAQLTHAITFAAHHTACIDLMNRHFHARLRGRGQALYSVIGYGASGVLGGVGGGWLIQNLGFAAVFWAAAAAGLVAVACAWQVERCGAARQGA